MFPSSIRGLSPLARGNPHRGAGQTRGVGVYPRWRGGTAFLWWRNHECQGLSPLARGNRATHVARRRAKRSIPAGAGEPILEAMRLDEETVYPRWRGGTAFCFAAVSASRGLSPLARGNPPVLPARSPCKGSIPAGAGEPAQETAPLESPPVYPRWRGGTTSGVGKPYLPWGLSPLARVNFHQH